MQEQEHANRCGVWVVRDGIGTGRMYLMRQRQQLNEVTNSDFGGELIDSTNNLTHNVIQRNSTIIL